MDERRWTVAHLRPQREHVEVMFNESARIYRLSRANPAFEPAMRTLQRAEAGGGTVGVELSTEDEEIIDAVLP